MDGKRFPIFDVPVAAIDLDDTLAYYDGWRGETVIGKPRPNAIWALKCFKWNGWEVEINTNRGNVRPIWKWVHKYAHGLVDRINESKKEPIFGSGKAIADVFIDDRDEYWFGKELDWVEIMNRLNDRGFLKKGLLKRVA
jgi:hypothetical protein